VNWRPGWRKSGTGFDLPTKKAQLEQAQNQMSRPGFWDNQEAAQRVTSQLSALKAVIDPAEQLQKDIKDLAELYELAAEEGDQKVLTQIENDVHSLTKRCDQTELQGLLSGPHDMKNCFLSIHAGAGGTESCDWASMLLRMYTRFCDKQRYKYEELSITPGEEAGIRSVTMRIAGPFSYGKLSCEVGVHRLVRISPFDANARRHTSFVAVDVLPELPETDSTLKEIDLDIVYFRRSSGAGGQNVNKVATAVRIRHIPSDIIVECVNERSQAQNKKMALSILQAKIERLEQDKRDQEVARLYGEKGEIAWGNQIRSYVLQPYQLVKDHRTDHETGNVNAILDGEIDEFIDSYLHYRVKNKGKDAK
jgi:peptide chain release factor 2